MFQVYPGEGLRGLLFPSGLLPSLQHTLQGPLGVGTILCSGNTISNKTKGAHEAYILEVRDKVEAGDKI